LTKQHELLDTAIKKIGNRYLATMLIAKRVRQLYRGAKPLVIREDNESLFTVAVREVVEGQIVFKLPTAASAVAIQASEVAANSALNRNAEARRTNGAA
jgi:DNA-directed RNA polymerase subunit omega